MRLIDAHALIAEMHNVIFEDGEDRRIVYEVIERQPSAGPEIITCKDCEWWEKQKDSLQGRCALMQMYPTGQWYCGNAQRRVSSEKADIS